MVEIALYVMHLYQTKRTAMLLGAVISIVINSSRTLYIHAQGLGLTVLLCKRTHVVLCHHPCNKQGYTPLSQSTRTNEELTQFLN